MITFGFLSNLNPALAGGIRVGLILVMALVIVFAARRIIPRLMKARIPKIREERPQQLAERSQTLSRILVQVVSIVISVMTIIMILSGLGVDITPLLASLGVASLAFGFAAQNIIRDYLHGFFIIMEDWYRIGEWVAVVGVEGTVEQVTLRRTLLREIDGTLHSIPNSQISFSGNRMRDWGRINLTVSVAYKEHLDRVYEVLNEVCQDLKDDPEWGGNLLTTPAVVRVGALNDNGVGIVIRGDTKTGQHWSLTGELRRRIKNRFDEVGIEIPWPHTKVYFGNAPGGNGDQAHLR